MVSKWKSCWIIRIVHAYIQFVNVSFSYGLLGKRYYMYEFCKFFMILLRKILGLLFSLWFDGLCLIKGSWFEELRIKTSKFGFDLVIVTFFIKKLSFSNFPVAIKCCSMALRAPKHLAAENELFSAIRTRAQVLQRLGLVPKSHDMT